MILVRGTGKLKNIVVKQNGKSLKLNESTDSKILFSIVQQLARVLVSKNQEVLNVRE